jgi:hypothetical protein
LSATVTQVRHTHISDPAIFFSLYLLKCPSDSGVDGRVAVLRGMDAFIEKHGLQPYAPRRRRYNRARDIDLLDLAKSSPTFEILLQCHNEYPKTPAGTYYECLAYCYHDALILQVMITKFKDWSGGFLDGWNELTGSLRACFNEEALAGAQPATLGVSAVYWAIADSNPGMGAREEPFRAIAEERDLSQSATDLGAPLWHCEHPLFPGCQAISQDLWMLVTPRQAEAQVNPRFYQPRLNGPPDFAIVALARHKIAYERTEYLREQQGANRIHDDLERRIRKMVDMQRRLGPELEELRSHNAVEFQRELAATGAVLADYGQSVGLLKEIRNTVAVNQRNFLINSVALISQQGADEVARSVDQEAAAARFFAGSHRDQIFARETSTFQGLCQQLDSELEYGNSLTERHAATLGSARDQLQISGQRELGEIAHHLSIDSAAVVASVVAVIATEMILRPESPVGDPIARWSLAFALVVGSFALTQVLSSGCRGKHLERWSTAIAIGFFGVFFANRYFSAEHLPFLAQFDLRHLHEVAALLLATLVGWFIHRLLKKYRVHAVRQRALKTH